mgnify:CR=1 FL=1
MTSRVLNLTEASFAVSPEFLNNTWEFGSLLVVGALALLLKKTSFGLQMRSVTQNRRMASAMGIRTGWVDAMTFGLGSGIAGMAGVALSQIDNVSPNLGQGYIIDSFMVVVFGGVGNLWGTLVAAFTLGIGNKLLEPLAGAVLAKILLLLALNYLPKATPVETTAARRLLDGAIALGAGIGFTLALVLLAGLREESELSDVPALIKGTAMNLIIAGILSMAFMGFAGLFSST